MSYEGDAGHPALRWRVEAAGFRCFDRLIGHLANASSAKTGLALQRRSDANIRFADLRTLMQYLGFDERIRGSHHVYRGAGVAEKVNLQRDNGNAKPCQVRQLRRLILKYKLGRAD